MELTGSNKTFFKATGTLLGGNIIAQILPYLALILLARLYTPTEFGEFAFFTALSTTIVILATGRYELAILLPENIKDAWSLVWLASCLAGFISLVLLLILYGLTFLDYSPNLWLPLAIFPMAIFQVLMNWFLRLGAYTRISASRFVQAGMTVLASLIFGWIGFHQGLITGYILGWSAGVFFLLGLIYLQSPHLKLPSINQMYKNAKCYSDHAIYGAIPALFDSLSIFALIFIVNHHYGSDITGQLNVSKQFAYSPISLVIAAVGQVIYRESRQLLVNKTGDKSLFLRMTYYLAYAATTYIVCLMLFAPSLFPLILGTSWSFSGKITVILAIAYGIRLIVTTLSVFLLSHNALRLNGAWQGLYFIVISGLYFFYPAQPMHFFILLALIDVILFTLYFLIIQHVVNKGEQSPCVA